MARVEERVAHLEGQMTELSRGLSEVKGAIRHLDDKVSRQFVWLVGIIVTALVAIVGAVLSRG